VSGIAAWIGAHNASSCSAVSLVRAAITRPPNAAVLTAAHPPLPATRIGTVTTAASAAASSPVRELPSAIARDRTLDSSSVSCHGFARTAHWLAPRRPTAVTYRDTIAPSDRGFVTGIADANWAYEAAN